MRVHDMRDDMSHAKCPSYDIHIHDDIRSALTSVSPVLSPVICVDHTRTVYISTHTCDDAIDPHVRVSCACVTSV